MNKEIWPFLVSANEKIEYGVVVAPDFMCQQNCEKILHKAAGLEGLNKNAPYYRRIINSKVGNLTLVFQVVKAVAGDAGIAGDAILTDSWGRDIDLIEGIVFREDISSSNIVITSEHFDRVHEEVIQYYRQFWNKTKGQEVPAYSSQPFLLKESGDNSFELIKLEDYIAGSQPRKNPESDRSWESSSVQIPDSPKSASDRSWTFSYLPFSSNGEIQSIAIFPKGDKIAIRYSPKNIWDFSNIVVWDTKQQRKLHEFSGTRAAGAYDTPVVINYRGNLIASAMIASKEKSVIKTWNVDTGNEQDLGSQGSCFDRFIAFPNIAQLIGIKAVAFTPDGETVISGGDDGEIKFWCANGEGEISITDSKRSAQIRCMTVDRNNSILASGDQKGNIQIWQLVKRGTPNLIYETTIQTHNKSINSLAFSPNGKILVSAGEDRTVKLWNMKTDEPYDRLQREHSTFVNSVAFSPNGSLIASGDDGGIIKIWNLKNERSVVLPKTHDDAVTSVVFTRDGKLISGGKDGKLIKWEPVK